MPNSNCEEMLAARVKTQTHSTCYATWFTWIICLTGALFYCYEYLLRVMPSIMELELREAFKLDSVAFGNLMGFYYYAYTPMQFPVGILMDSYGPRRLLILACLICALGSYLFTMQSHLLLSQIGRLFVGFGSAFAFIGFLKLATLWLPARRFSFVTGLIMTLCMLGVTQGNLLIDILMENQGWKNTIFVFATFGILLSFAMALIIPKENGHNPEHFPVQSLKHLIQELFNLAKNPYLWANGMIGCFLFLSLSAFGEAWGISYFQEGRGFSKELAVHTNNYLFWGWAVGSPFIGWFSDIIKHRRSLLIFGALGTALTFWALLFLPYNTPVWTFKTLLFLVGIFSSSQILVFPIARELSSSALAATSLAFTNFLVMIGGVILQPGVGYLLQLKWDGQMINNVPVYSLHAYQFSLSALTIAALLAAFIGLFTRETYQK
ncbi:MAG TPA: MFS transporter [Gammaproteobacteria bacterium]|nr:MFS transporter [Gammaproteobacteria bacterium]